MRTLDRIDTELIALLQNNARLSNKELAAAVGLAPSSCLERVRRLIRSGVFEGFHARVNRKAVGVGLEAMIAVRLGRHTQEIVEGFRDYSLGLPETLDLYHVAGKDDFLVHVAVRDADHLRDMTMSAFTTRDEVVHIETHLIFQHARSGTLPIYVEMSDP